MRELARSQGDSCQSSAYNVLDFAIVFLLLLLLLLPLFSPSPVLSVVDRQSSVAIIIMKFIIALRFTNGFCCSIVPPHYSTVLLSFVVCVS